MKPLSCSMAVLLLTASLAGTVLAKGPWAASPGNTWGYQLMTPQERTEHQARMRSFKSYEECKAYQEENHKQMEARAREKGTTLPAMRAGGFGCDNMKARGYLK
ncbi:MAG: hypothetical protein PSV40_11740 [Polaromonas sp.]|uniref:hypothetical protein n=1 Tax=Polaromonas sp. TaxID=1869339 RepID=UPI002489943C|nr:hypothetical protein [Polaromonas sp.]MDI1269756.1 hypothetical protein [Polaromonas sp.]